MNEMTQTTPISYLYDKVHENDVKKYEIVDALARKNIADITGVAVEDLLKRLQEHPELQIKPISIKKFEEIIPSTRTEFVEYEVILNDENETHLDDHIFIPKGSNGFTPILSKEEDGIYWSTGADASEKHLLYSTEELKGAPGNPTDFMVAEMPESANIGDQVIYIGPEDSSKGITFGQTYKCTDKNIKCPFISDGNKAIYFDESFINYLISTYSIPTNKELVYSINSGDNSQSLALLQILTEGDPIVINDRDCISELYTNGLKGGLLIIITNEDDFDDPQELWQWSNLLYTATWTPKFQLNPVLA